MSVFKQLFTVPKVRCSIVNRENVVRTKYVKTEVGLQKNAVSSRNGNDPNSYLEDSIVIADLALEEAVDEAE